MKSVFQRRRKREMARVDIGENVEDLRFEDISIVTMYNREIGVVVSRRRTLLSAQTKCLHFPNFSNT